MIGYIIKVVLCSALLMLAYKLFLEKEKTLKFNRIYLLISLVLPFVIPLISFDITVPALHPLYHTMTNLEVPDLQITAYANPVVEQNHYTSFLLIGYLTITLFLLFRMANSLKRIYREKSGSAIVPFHSAAIVLTRKNISPYSFWNYIFVNKDLYTSGQIEDEIIFHELTHVRQKHSCDLLLADLIQAFFWINPVHFMYRKSIQLNHEFLADDQTIKTYGNVFSYQSLLINKAGCKDSSPLVSGLNYYITKKRLKMMTKSTVTIVAIAKIMLVVSVSAFCIIIFSGSALPYAGTIEDNTSTLTRMDTVPNSMLEEFAQILEKVTGESGVPAVGKLSASDKKRLQTIYLSMSKEQQHQQVVMFWPYPPPMKKQSPTAEQLNSWKDEKTFGVWIDGKRIKNSDLSNHQRADFDHFFVSKLSKNAINYGKHFYQINLMTKASYAAYYEEALAKQGEYTMFVSMKPKKRK